MIANEIQSCMPLQESKISVVLKPGSQAIHYSGHVGIEAIVQAKMLYEMLYESILANHRNTDYYTFL